MGIYKCVRIISLLQLFHVCQEKKSTAQEAEVIPSSSGSCNALGTGTTGSIEHTGCNQLRYAVLQ